MFCCFWFFIFIFIVSLFINGFVFLKFLFFSKFFFLRFCFVKCFVTQENVFYCFLKFFRFVVSHREGVLFWKVFFHKLFFYEVFFFSWSLHSSKFFFEVVSFQDVFL